MNQHRAAHFVFKKPWRRNYQDSVSSVLADQQWPLLSQRRKCARLTLLYKSNNLLSIPSTYLPVPTPLLSTRSNQNQKFYSTTNQLIVTTEFSFFPRTVPEWNDLPTRIVQCKSLDIFNQYLHEYYYCIIICCTSALMPLMGFGDHNYNNNKIIK